MLLLYFFSKLWYNKYGENNMLKRIKGININYIEYGKNDADCLVLLHGWGQNIEMMQPIGNRMSKQYHIVIIDLPGFGNSDEPTKVWTVYDYAEALHELLKNLSINEPIMIGHSFGGKISLVYASKYKVKKLVTFGSPFKKEIQQLSMKTKILKSLKKVPGINKLEEFAKKHIGSSDYKNASKMMRDILVDTVNLDISEDVKKISCPTLLIWGTNDEAVSINDAYELEKLIPDAGVVEYEGCTHYAYLERLDYTITVLNAFLGGK